MNKLEQLIQELCPHGVEYKKLGEVCTFKKGNSITKASIEQGTIPVIAGGLKPAYYCNQYNRTGENIVVSSSGINAGFISYWNEPIFVSDAFSIHCDISLLYKYLYYYLLILQNKIFACKKEGGIPHVYSKDITKFLIPIPPLEIQKEIVHILDTFTELEKELEKELEARKKQYEFYREQLLFSKDYNKVFLNDIAINYDNKRIPITQSKREKGEFPYYGASGIVDYVKSYIFDGDYLLISEDGANLVARTTPIIFSVSGKFWVNNHAHILKFENYCTQKYVEHYVNAIDISKYISTAAQPKLTKENLNKIPIPLPPLEEQKRIVNILDRFDALCNDLTCGLPAEIEARRKQYTYYRDKLLTFKNIAENS